MRMLQIADHIARGNGWAMGQMRITRADGTVEYHYSSPQFRWFNLKGWFWYWAHKRDIRRNA